MLEPVDAGTRALDRRTCARRDGGGERSSATEKVLREAEGDRLALRPDRFAQLKRLADLRQLGNER